MAETTPKPLIFNDWNNGMADSPDLGVGLLQDVSIDTVPGALMPNYAPQVMSPVASSSIFTWDHTVNSGTGTITGSFPQLVTGSAIQLTNSGGAAPTGLSVATTYFIIKVDSTHFQLASTLANALSSTAISTSDNGSGTNTMATINFGTAMHSVMNPNTGYIFVLDSNGQLWYSPSGGSQLYLVAGQTLTAAAGNGLCGFEVSNGTAFYLFVYRKAVIDVLNATGDTQLQDPVGQSAWTAAWQSMNAGAGSGAPHHSIATLAGFVYFCDTIYVGSINENAGQVFNPGTSGTYTYNNQALFTLNGEQCTWLELLNTQLLVAGGTYNYIYVWNRTDPTFSSQWVVPENNVLRLKNIGNTVYILAGARGNIYQSSGYIVLLTGKVPEWITQSTTSTSITIGGIGQKGGWLIFGIGTTGSGNGVWAIDPTNPQFSTMAGLGGRRLFENQLVNGHPVTTILVPSVATIPNNPVPNQEFYYLGGGDSNGANGEFSMITTNRYSAYGTALYQSGLRAVGNKIVKAKYSRLEVQLNQPGLSGNTVRVSWRNATSGSWTVMAGGSTNGVFVCDGTVTSFTQDIGLHDLENIQVQVELKGAGSGSSALQVMSVILYP
jgi:hypothetical protein